MMFSGTPKPRGPYFFYRVTNFLFSFFCHWWSIIKNAVFPCIFSPFRDAPLATLSRLSFAYFPGVVKYRMGGFCHELKVFYIIIKGIFINVMDNFMSLKWTANMKFHNYPMFKHFFATMHNKTLALMCPSLNIFMFFVYLGKATFFNDFRFLFISFMRHSGTPFLIIKIPCNSGFVNNYFQETVS